MQPDGPYRYTHLLGGSPVGKAWAALDQQGRLVTVAVLDATVAAAPGWREAFAGTANNLAQAPGGTPFTYADFAAAAPWVAYSAEAGPAAEKLFQALGVEYAPAPTSSPPASGMPVSPASGLPVSGPPGTASGPPSTGSPDAVPATPTSAAPSPISGAPASPGTGWQPSPVSAAPQSPRPYAAPEDPFSSQTPRIVPSTPRRRRPPLWIGAGAAVVAVAIVGGVAVWALSGGDDEPSAAPNGVATVAPPALPTAPPQSPGVEPPTPGAWPTQWPKFTELDEVRTLSDLEGLGFPVKVPVGWQCTPAARADGYVRYTCGNSATGQQLTGGELIVRDCPEPCNAQWQNAMRAVEEAWGAQWIRSGEYASYAEQIIEVDGEQRHGLVVVAYFRSGEASVVNRQVVIRMTAPVPEAYQLRRFAGYIRDVVVF
ncbi:hypothetical protein [Micromonospora radicis]|uniref:Uncharacterized protein n=1 Tax=Micromonospora radicis TaxID=1894971 RepID=A0A418MS15_9ACTN|nr:hypothetical protein [Micromonospora radicis]RIV36765.1 hypothetical protein D2L64_18675 [Micromonospora radicis]